MGELNEYLISDMLDDYWYDDALFVCEDIINEFTDEEWRKTQSEIPSADDRWNMRLVECMGDINDLRSIECIMKLTNTDNMSCSWHVWIL